MVVPRNQAKVEEASGLEEEAQEAMVRVNQEVETVVLRSEGVPEIVGPVGRTRDHREVREDQVAREVREAQAVQEALEERIAEAETDNQTRTTRYKGRW